MTRPILAEAQIHPAIREQITRHEHAIEEEVQNFITTYQDKLLTNDNKQIVRNG